MSKFDRKHYFYHDLPSGWQITQKYRPIAADGCVQVYIKSKDGFQDVRIEQLQLEQDTSRSLHAGDNQDGQTWLDDGRAGSPLIEIISRPDMHSSEEASAFVKTVQETLRAIGVSEASMDKGSLRVDVNVSLAPDNAQTLGNRCEVKNLNGISFMTDAIEAELTRQSSLLRQNLPVHSQTRYFDEESGETFTLRSKDDAPDYRYLPDPDIPPLFVTQALISEAINQMPLTPAQVRNKLVDNYNLSHADASKITNLGNDSVVALHSFEYLTENCNPALTANWLIHELQGILRRRDKEINFAELDLASIRCVLRAMDNKQLTTQQGRLCMEKILDGSKDWESFLTPVTVDTEALAAQIILQNSVEVAKFKAGKTSVLQRLVGQAMKVSKGKANPKLVGEAITRQIACQT